MLEIACFNALSAITAAKAGASRIELCADYAAGGVTPTLSTLHSIRSALEQSSDDPASPDDTELDNKRIPINVMIRPRSGNFTYSPTSLSQMKSTIEMFKSSRMVDGFVFGILTPSLQIDIAPNEALVALAHPLPCTFHRAIDEVEDLDAAVEAVIECGFKSILTSGGAKTASEGKVRVAELQRKFGGRISVIAGGGVRSGNVRELKMETGVEWVHSAAVTGEGEEVDEQEVRRMVEILQDA